jgi:hypothetical protein
MHLSFLLALNINFWANVSTPGNIFWTMHYVLSHLGGGGVDSLCVAQHFFICLIFFICIMIIRVGFGTTQYNLDNP